MVLMILYQQDQTNKNYRPLTDLNISKSLQKTTETTGATMVDQKTQWNAIKGSHMYWLGVLLLTKNLRVEAVN